MLIKVEQILLFITFFCEYIYFWENYFPPKNSKEGRGGKVKENPSNNVTLSGAQSLRRVHRTRFCSPTYTGTC